MPTKRNNEVKEFAIGTKIEYNGKLYEVVRSKYCDGCSIASICSSNDITSGNRIGDVLSRDKRLSIFGECSSITRDDNTSIIFKEIPMTKSDSNNNVNTNIIQPLVEGDGTVKDLQIKPPSGYMIDIDNSDLANNIIKFKRKWLSIEDIHRLVKENDYLTYRSSIVSFRDGKLIALANLMDITRYFNGNWNYDTTKGDIGYMIAYDSSTIVPYYSIRKIDSVTKPYYGNPVFKNEDDVRYVIDNPHFRAILDKIFKV